MGERKLLCNSRQVLLAGQQDNLLHMEKEVHGGTALIAGVGVHLIYFRSFRPTFDVSLLFLGGSTEQCAAPIVLWMFARSFEVGCIALVVFWLVGYRQSSDRPADVFRDEQSGISDQFLRLVNAGKSYLDQGDATNALAVYRRAQAIFANSVDLHLNVANAHLLAGAEERAIREADEALRLDRASL